MILSNSHVVAALRAGDIVIDPSPHRLGMLVHFSAPTVHAGFEGNITLEIINLGPNSIQLIPDVYICQIVFETVAGTPQQGPSQFRGQRTPAGDLAA